jgi:hypothetical protein
MGLGDGVQGGRNAAADDGEEMMIRILFPLLAAFVVAGCGERPQVLAYKQGKYQGKPDTAAYANAPYNGDRQAWENAIKQRNQAQNEYARLKD